MSRIKRALRFSELQVTVFVPLSVLMVAAYYKRECDHNMFMTIFLCLFWPFISFISNLIDPPQ